MEEIYQKFIGSNFSDFKGLTANATIPVPQYLVNEIIEYLLIGNKSIDSCQVVLQEQNHVSVNLKTKILPWSLNLKLKLDTAVDFASYSSPKIRAWLENNRFLGSLGSLINALPEGVKVYGDQVVVDVWSFLRTPEQRQFLGLIKSVDIQTKAAKVVFDITIRVDE
jgi:hypothetical protein